MSLLYNFGDNLQTRNAHMAHLANSQQFRKLYQKQMVIQSKRQQTVVDETKPRRSSKPLMKNRVPAKVTFVSAQQELARKSMQPKPRIGQAAGNGTTFLPAGKVLQVGGQNSTSGLAEQFSKLSINESNKGKRKNQKQFKKKRKSTK